MHFERKQLEGSPLLTGIDYPAMIAAMLAAQSKSRIAASQIDHDVTRDIENCPEQAITMLMQAHPGWRVAAGVLCGSFHPGVAALINANSL
jgi:SH3-like domain-containing protein